MRENGRLWLWLRRLRKVNGEQYTKIFNANRDKLTDQIQCELECS